MLLDHNDLLACHETALMQYFKASVIFSINDNDNKRGGVKRSIKYKKNLTALMPINNFSKHHFISLFFFSPKQEFKLQSKTKLPGFCLEEIWSSSSKKEVMVGHLYFVNVLFKMRLGQGKNKNLH